MTKYITTDQFILKARKIHGNQYEYDKFIYVKNSIKGVITCKIHGDFLQTPAAHTDAGAGCIKCRLDIKRGTLADFILKANEKHNNYYSYENFVYTTSRTKGNITCPVHGDFLQTPDSHINKHQGCYKCYDERRPYVSRSNTEDFITKAKMIHGNKYEYNKTIYIKTDNPVIISCKLHGDFSQTPRDHLSGCGCRKCIGRIVTNTSEFIKNATIIHNEKYVYTKTIYEKTSKKTIITCRTHGDFLQTPNDHLDGCGCPKCGNGLSRPANMWLDSLGILPEYREYRFNPNNKKQRCDGYNPIENCIYEYYGDKVHGSPMQFAENDTSLWNNTMGERYTSTILREKLIRSLGYNLVTIWHHEWLAEQNNGCAIISISENNIETFNRYFQDR